MLTSQANDTELPARLRLAITRLARRLRQESGSGLSPSLTAALATIDRHGPLAPSELAEFERVKRPTATRIVNGLDSAGLIAREPDPDDRRGVRVSVSPEGRALLRRLRKRKTAYLARRLEKLDPEELATLERAAVLLERLLEDER
ncbi:MAG: MarR family winged helix-turn-helix transcriptional regulator [Solirubrobacteraceae bacterium]